MPIKEIMTISAVILGSLFVIHPLDFPEAVRQLKMRILREAVRTDNWGNPSIFPHGKHTSPSRKGAGP